MPKSSQKTADSDQPNNQRGKSRFGASGRPARVVLPERPPRAVDNEIVSILLGADPTALVTQAAEVKSTAPTEPADGPQSLIPLETSSAPPAATTRAEATATSDLEASDARAESVPVNRTSVEITELTAATEAPTEVADASLPSPSESNAATPARVRRVPSVPKARPAAEPVKSAVQEVATEDGTAPSFEDFVERWKHGLRKGQLKVCEVLYQKTYAVGQTECVTSFAELGRLSGLKMRQCFNIIAQLEALRFVERSKAANTSNKKDQGSVIRFHLYPVQ